MNIVTVCGMGFGTSLILKMAVDEILKKNGIAANVEACDLGSVKGKVADLVVSTSELESELKNLNFNIVFVKNAIDKKDIEEKVLEAIKKLK
ncbi:PTS system IIB component, L-Asc family [Thermoanaerobacter thermohydrosulfuricus]|jgi:PTS system ascorbate-specific IIB component|uniref:Phosphotransferase system lactose/cellobiose-specific IIB subunit n=4 Tax=Thermoanaerobacter TaxID=1754 RepID=G2MSM5_9THEO|nr:MULTISPECIES: PTS sugar transporter subunit IIB [Thermoanaerobacter]AEM77802.1 LOW QUALITY PROTEIN: phosphotransferase system lactose/cellobiose-specific IIB subunit [Thermoanaerobacter wiegelii Rt8.B1]EGD50366.1 phosphotransferase system lactose/cellobiose-specific IIB subunit [Thermoanaerobacter ethanolicus JW 200]EMT39180.1 Phosphotransferase system, galactitol-specific IIB component [Thermoanaerobacter thermohydrosulfuricus WC1]MDP9752024.1 PTS system ascorbate-specific IIB component [Th